MDGVESINAIHAFIVRDMDGTEGIPAIRLEGMDFPFPLITAAATRSGQVLENMRGWAREMEKQLQPGQTMTHAVFTSRQDLDKL